MRLTVLAFDLPYPANSGGRLDIWLQLCALAEAGHQAQLWCFSPETPGPAFGAAMRAAGITEVHVLPYPGALAPGQSAGEKLRRAARKYLSPVPSCASASDLDGEALHRVCAAIAAFDSELLLAHGIQTTGAAQAVARALPRLPWIYRSHNHETRYYAALAHAAGWGAPKLGLLWQRWRLAWYEPRVLRRAGAVLHISLSEQRHFVAAGYSRQLWAPPVYRYQSAVRTEPRVWDVGVLSSWFATQKIEGLRWLADEVKPLLPAACKIAVAGSGAPAWLADWCRSRGLEFLGPVESPADFYARCGVLVNPVLRGAGVNMKTMEMLATGRPVVSTPAGLAGLPESVADSLRVGRTASELAFAIREALDRAPPQVPPSVFEPFSTSAFMTTLSIARELAGTTLL